MDGDNGDFMQATDTFQIEFGTSIEKGLSIDQAAVLGKYGPNELTPTKHDPWWLRLIKSVFGCFFNALLWIGSVLCLITYAIDQTDIKDHANVSFLFPLQIYNMSNKPDDRSDVAVYATATFNAADSDDGVVEVDNNGNVIIDLDLPKLDTSDCNELEYRIYSKNDYDDYDDCDDLKSPSYCDENKLGNVFNPFETNMYDAYKGDIYFECATGDLSGGIFGYYQEYKSTDLMDSLSKMKPKNAIIIRSNKRIQSEPANLVPVDICELTLVITLPADLGTPDVEATKVK